MTQQTVTCPDCQGLSKVDTSAGDDSFRCPHCQKMMSVGGQANAKKPAMHARFQCPGCSGLFQLNPEIMGDLVKCPHCLDTVRISSPAAEVPCTHGTEDSSPGAKSTSPPIIVDQQRESNLQADESFAISLGGDQHITLYDRAKTVQWRGATIRLRKLTNEERASRRRVRNLIMGISCVLLLVITAALLLQLT